MKPLFDLESLPYLKGISLVKFQCEWCDKEFTREAKNVRSSIKLNDKNRHRYCSISCAKKFKDHADGKVSRQDVECKQCGVVVKRVIKDIKSSKSGNNFCSSSCAATYNNMHKTTGTRRAKLENWVENQLTQMYPSLEIHFNRKDTINSELDIYIPSLRLAVEINGIFHYEPICGQEKLASIQNNDDRKFQACLELGIELLIVEIGSQKYLEIIKTVINKKLIPID